MVIAQVAEERLVERRMRRVLGVEAVEEADREEAKLGSQVHDRTRHDGEAPCHEPDKINVEADAIDLETCIAIRKEQLEVVVDHCEAQNEEAAVCTHDHADESHAPPHDRFAVAEAQEELVVVPVAGAATVLSDRRDHEEPCSCRKEIERVARDAQVVEDEARTVDRVRDEVALGGDDADGHENRHNVEACGIVQQDNRHHLQHALRDRLNKSLR
mmetsp:Transcript_5197/g.8787  ORF Transcript_5197/g.8787 Transcript_5197/m.8787 type:complete len:215 (-) Transcript_5197:518-1162(-)